MDSRWAVHGMPIVSNSSMEAGMDLRKVEIDFLRDEHSKRE
jgi:hypothetical protein